MKLQVKSTEEGLLETIQLAIEQFGLAADLQLMGRLSTGNIKPLFESGERMHSLLVSYEPVDGDIPNTTQQIEAWIDGVKAGWFGAVAKYEQWE